MLAQTMSWSGCREPRRTEAALAAAEASGFVVRWLPAYSGSARRKAHAILNRDYAGTSADDDPHPVRRPEDARADSIHPISRQPLQLIV
jgi:hypothetical protein